MSVAYWIFAGLILLGSLVNISNVGKPREPLEGHIVAIATGIHAGLIYLLVMAAMNR